MDVFIFYIRQQHDGAVVTLWEVRVLMIRTRIQVSMMLLGPPFGTFRVPPISPYSCPSSRELVNVAGRKSSSEVNSHQLADPRLIHNEIQTLLPITTDTSVVKRGLIEELLEMGFCLPGGPDPVVPNHLRHSSLPSSLAL